MHLETLSKWQHKHEFISNTRANEQKTLRVVILTASMMVFEIIGGTIFGSMALQADGWHMGTHAGALGISLFAYWYARRHASDPRYSFGTGKISVLGGFTSAIILQVVAILMAIEAVLAPDHPPAHPVHRGDHRRGRRAGGQSGQRPAAG